VVASLARTLRLSEPRRFLLVLGPRRVGKTTAMYQIVKQLLLQGVPAESLWWFRMDHPLGPLNNRGAKGQRVRACL
jgi:predicted AAA+ superfamily ATPase